MGGQQKSQWNRKRQHPLAHRHLRDHLIYQVGGCLCHAPRPAGRAKPAPFTGEGDELLMGTVRATQAQKTVGQNAAFQEGIELVFDEIGQTRPGLSLDLREKGLDVFLYQLVQRCFFGTPPLVVYAFCNRRGLDRLVHELLYCFFKQYPDIVIADNRKSLAFKWRCWKTLVAPLMSILETVIAPFRK
jgi:hypothetical protein